MTLQIRLMQSKDAEPLLRLYEQFVLSFVGSAKRDLKQFQGITRKRDSLRWVALDEQERIIGYIWASYVKGRRTGRIHEIVTDPEYDFEAAARSLIDKVCRIFVEKGAAQIQAGTIQNPCYNRIFPQLGFWRMNPDGVFMYAILDVEKFLDEISPVIIQRLKRMRDWNGLLQITCENTNRLYRKEGRNVQVLPPADVDTDCCVTFIMDALVGVLLGATDLQKALSEGKIKIETSQTKKKTNELMNAIFPKKQFLVLDYW